MGVGSSIGRHELASLNRVELANLVSTLDPELAQYRQACIDFGLDGDILVRLPQDQLVETLRRAGVDDEAHLRTFLEALENVRWVTKLPTSGSA